MGISLLVFILLFALLYQYPAKPLNLVLLNILFDMFLINGLVYNILSKRKMSIE